MIPPPDHRPNAVLVVGDRALAEPLRGRGDVAVVAVDHYLDALGEMAHRRVDAVVGRLLPMGAAVEPTVRALRQVAPASRLLLVVDAEEEPTAMRAVRLGVDDYLVEPITGDAVARSLAEAGNGWAASPGESAVAGEAVAMDESTEAELIDRLVRHRPGLRELALQQLQQRVKLGDLRIVDQRDEQARACLPLRFAGRRVGYLVSHEADGDALRPHADWLARWLALDAHIHQLKDMALRDELTGVWNRRYFKRFFDSILNRARQQRFRVTLMLFDIDDFKVFNDRYGHDAGDEILCEAARLMQAEVRRRDVVARIGGDEFAVIFWDADAPRRPNSQHPHDVRGAAQRFQQAICQHRFPKLAEHAPGTLTISGGLASYPWDGQDAETLTRLADQMLFKSKRQGKNAITFGPGALRECQILDELLGETSAEPEE